MEARALYGTGQTEPRDAIILAQLAPLTLLRCFGMETLALSVLIVEDNPDGAESLAVLLDMFGYEVRIAFDGESALRLARKSPPDAVILDIGLPGLDGCAVAGELRAIKNPRPLLIAASGYPNIQAKCHSA